MTILWVNFNLSVGVFLIYRVFGLISLEELYRSPSDVIIFRLMGSASAEILVVFCLWFFYYRVKNPITVVIAFVYGVVKVIQALIVIPLQAEVADSEVNTLKLLIYLWIGISHMLVYKCFDDVSVRLK